LNALKTQVNPHFLFNNLNTLCSIIPEDPKKAVTFVEQLSKVYRYILEVRDEKTIPLQEEIQILKA
jgi:LytS/YehU family sensor histidine kinase